MFEAERFADELLDDELLDEELLDDESVRLHATKADESASARIIRAIF